MKNNTMPSTAAPLISVNMSLFRRDPETCNLLVIV